jgi:transcriptional regulator with XRE-family HTH domain
MNRIKELREERGLSTYQLAALVGTTQPTIHRLETGKRKLTVDWMTKIAGALGVERADLIAPTILDQNGDDVRPHETNDPLLQEAIHNSPRQLWKVIRPTLDYLGIKTGNVRVIDTTVKEIEALQTGDVVVIQVFDARDLTGPRTLLRQFVAPGLFITNSSKGNPPPLDAKRIDVSVLGVMLPQVH